jgi:hypothetical protein
MARSNIKHGFADNVQKLQMGFPFKAPLRILIYDILVLYLLGMRRERFSHRIAW